MLPQEYYSNGKLLLTGEYVVLDGAKAIALPTKFGQNLVVSESNLPYLNWESFNYDNEKWFSSKFNTANLEPNDATTTSLLLSKILKEARKLNKNFLSDNLGREVRTNLSFDKNWGLGTSSTLINNIAQWAEVDAFELLRNSFGGSGYDIACAQNSNPIFYQLVDKKPILNEIDFNPIFKDQLYFIYLNKKQNSRDEIKNYKKKISISKDMINQISHLSIELLRTETLSRFEEILEEHEEIIGSIVEKTPIQKELFSDYFGQVKSLGAWGGDFIMATGNIDTINYFGTKGFKTIFRYEDLIL